MYSANLLRARGITKHFSPVLPHGNFKVRRDRYIDSDKLERYQRLTFITPYFVA